ncbi:MAG: hypothetical protein EHM85_11005 [Desulfobacteraceae bacterium]|nr:MAG: hypothetical protein EHM85_11005 [Desulfobacteraceae bacterium]
MKAFAQYSRALIIQTADPSKGQDVTVAIEKEAMLTDNSPFAFAMALCIKRETFAYLEPRRFHHLARPSMDAYGIGIGTTVTPLGLKVEFDQDVHLLPAW